MIKYHLEWFGDSQVFQELRSNKYVVDWLMGADDQREVMALFEDVSVIMGRAGMRLAKCTSNAGLVCE